MSAAGPVESDTEPVPTSERMPRESAEPFREIDVRPALTAERVAISAIISAPVKSLGRYPYLKDVTEPWILSKSSAPMEKLIVFSPIPPVMAFPISTPSRK